jgi:hypothetical protein
VICPSCAGHGVFRLRYTDGSPDEYALCLCPAGEQMRLAKNNGRPVPPQWTVWAHQQGIDVARVAPMEVLLSDAEMAARGFAEVAPEQAIDAIAAAARARSKR